MSRDGASPGSPARHRFTRLFVTVVACALGAVAVAGLAVQAYRGNQKVGVQTSAATARTASLDDAFYRCIDVQAHSLVSPGQPVVLNLNNLPDFITLLKGVGSWVTIADSRSIAVAELVLRDNVQGKGTCLGDVVAARYARPHHGVLVQVGSGASLAGTGPPPAPPL